MSNKLLSYQEEIRLRNRRLGFILGVWAIGLFSGFITYRYALLG